ncbi:DUF1622 domain-containing protein [Salinispora arenicola]|uniref:DUF1622 domain-containing protein n=1 Tax=Salinispora arenicola (strain CNS-205) TaxID=391037 RepID=A8M3Z1_SALAI|nr:DUF1622 domain-containing protein [Salinispora arenicola]
MEDMLGEHWLLEAVDLLVRVVEAAGIFIIFIGAMLAFVRFVFVGLRHRESRVFVPIRLTLGRFLTLGLEFQLASDILRTAVAPTLLDIAELAGVAAIRTALNFFLAREIKQERREIAELGQPRRTDPDRVAQEPAP